MTIQIKSLGEVLGFVLASVAVLSTFALIHWKLFAAPIINRVLAPMVDNISTHQRILRKQFPEDYEKTEGDVKSERLMRGTA